MRIFKSRWFKRFARREGIADAALREAAARAEKGQIDADLGSGVIKQRIARKGQGRNILRRNRAQIRVDPALDNPKQGLVCARVRVRISW